MTKPAVFWLKTAITFCCLFLVMFPVQAGGWRAGLGKQKITPENPIRMGGYAARDRPSEKGADLTDLWVKAIVFTAPDGKRAVMACADIIRFPRFVSDSIRKQLHALYGLEKEQILLNGSHTHSGPEIDVRHLQYIAHPRELREVAEYSEKFIAATVRAIGEAIDQQFEAEIYSGQARARFAVNRRNNKENDILTLRELKGPVDHTVPVLKVTDKKQQVKAVLFGYACHPTVLSGYEISGDYPAYAQISLEKKFPGAQAMFFIGAAGDQNPLPRRTVPLAVQYGEELAAAVEAG